MHVSSLCDTLQKSFKNHKQRGILKAVEFDNADQDP
jgi:hypothetical protein